MYLKSLKLHGFKSFANRTEFEFHLESPVLLDQMDVANQMLLMLFVGCSGKHPPKLYEVVKWRTSFLMEQIKGSL